LIERDWLTGLVTVGAVRVLLLAAMISSTHYWIRNQVHAERWAELPSSRSHFDNLEPRTTNLAKGWHNGLNSNLGVSHPSTLRQNWTTSLKWDMFLLSIPTCHCYGQFQYTVT